MPAAQGRHGLRARRLGEPRPTRLRPGRRVRRRPQGEPPLRFRRRAAPVPRQPSRSPRAAGRRRRVAAGPDFRLARASRCTSTAAARCSGCCACRSPGTCRREDRRRRRSLHSHGRCYSIAPELLTYNDEGFVTIRGSATDALQTCWRPPARSSRRAQRELSGSYVLGEGDGALRAGVSSYQRLLLQQSEPRTPTHALAVALVVGVEDVWAQCVAAPLPGAELLADRDPSVCCLGSSAMTRHTSRGTSSSMSRRAHQSRW